MSASDHALAGRVKEIVARVLGVDAEAVELTARIDQIAEIDSLSIAEIASALDDSFSIHIPSAAMIEATTVADLVGVVDGLVDSRNASSSG